MSDLNLSIDYDFLSEEDYRELARDKAGNWKKASNFVWYAKPDNDPDDWVLWCTHNRDSGMLERSNAAVISATLERFFNVDSPYIQHEDHNHWAVGWVAGYAVKAHDRQGRITKPFKAMCYIQYLIDQYPVLNGGHYSELEYDECAEVVRNEGKRYVRDDAPEGWEYEVLSILLDMEYWTGEEFWPEKDDLISALDQMGIIDPCWLEELEHEGLINA